MPERDEAAAAQAPEEIPTPQIPERMSASGTLPPLLVSADQIALSANGKTRGVSLEALLAAPQPDPLAMLLYAQILILRDCETSLRRLAIVAETGQAQAAAHAADPGTLIAQLMKDLAPELEKFGVSLPKVPEAQG